MNVLVIMMENFEDCEWALDGDQYEGLEWLDKNKPKPTKAELEKMWPEVEKRVANRQVREAREEAYRLTADPIFLKYQRGEASKEEWIAAVEKVREDNPYPYEND